jgi:site-specific recombinase XerD
LKDSITRIGDKISTFLLGMLIDDYYENIFKNRNKKIRKQINGRLKQVSEQLNLSQPLNLGVARDCYANTLDLNNIPLKQISQMLGHSNVVITEHYLAGLNPDVTFGIIETIL